MKKALTLLLTLVVAVAAFSGCSGSENEHIYNYSLHQFTAGIWGGEDFDDVTIDANRCSLIFDADKKEITFNCDGQTYIGVLAGQRALDTSEMWSVEWETAPAGTDEYVFDIASFTCGQDYDQPTPFVLLRMYFVGEKNTIEVDFSMKYTETSSNTAAV